MPWRGSDRHEWDKGQAARGLREGHGRRRAIVLRSMNASVAIAGENAGHNVVISVPDETEGLRHRLASLAVSRGYVGAVYMHLGHGLRGAADPSAKVSPQRLLATTPLHEAEYRRRNYLAHDALAERAAESLAPFTWRLEEFADSDPVRQNIQRAMGAWGLQEGVIAPVQDYSLGPAFLNLFRSSRPAQASPLEAEASQGQLMLAAAQFHAIAITALPAAGEVGREACLSAREMTVLRLAAIGRTEQETAFSLSLSRRGVQFHLARAVEKLGAANKTAAVARAVSAGLIRL